ncbi:MAG TPA: hypothetical protein VM431_14230 [Phycisphaerae bacterium]|nr:hypothetical protein [Phycisphaerae bacterium]
MGQYRPEGRVRAPAGRLAYPEIARSPTADEVAETRRGARALGLRLDGEA